MTTQLRIYWDGNAPGLSDGRLSLAAFGPALQALLKAARNIARQQVAAAVGEEYDEAKATKSTLVDLQLSSFTSGSAQPTLDVIPLASNVGAMHLIENLPERVTKELHEGIRAEAQGVRRNRFINEFLHLLPKELTKQKYSLVLDGEVEDTFDVEHMRLLEPVEDYPDLILLKGQVEGVNFGSHGDPQIRFIPWNGKRITAFATKAQVGQAIAHQDSAQALFLRDAKTRQHRVLWIRADGAPPSRGASDTQLASMWESALERLDD
ncbi:hypothetical protein Mx9_p03 [Myxococcus phage Mx9]|nr:hypothetical protein Mx9_p03 [Myxococcus phage Mx9]